MEIMSTVAILNILGIVVFIAAFLFVSDLLIYIAIGLIIASVVVWRVKSRSKSKDEEIS